MLYDCLMSVWSLSDVSMTIITHVIAQMTISSIVYNKALFIPSPIFPHELVVIKTTESCLSVMRTPGQCEGLGWVLITMPNNMTHYCFRHF